MIGPPWVNLKRATVIANRGIAGVPLWVSGMRIPMRNKCVRSAGSLRVSRRAGPQKVVRIDCQCIHSIIE